MSDPITRFLKSLEDDTRNEKESEDAKDEIIKRMDREIDRKQKKEKEDK